MPIPIEVSYTTIGKRKIRNVLGGIFPTVLTQRLYEIGYARHYPVRYVEMGDVDVDWSIASPGYDEMIKSGEQND